MYYFRLKSGRLESLELDEGNVSSDSSAPPFVVTVHFVLLVARFSVDVDGVIDVNFFWTFGGVDESTSVPLFRL